MRKILSEFVLGVNLESIKEKIIIAPCWLPETVGINERKKIGSTSCQIWDCIMQGHEFSYIVTGVGAAGCMDVVFALGETRCKEILFIGSAGALKKGINIGDFAMPRGVFSGEGASRYIGDRLKDDVFGNRYFVTKSLRNRIMKCLECVAKKESIDVHDGMGISVESIFLQYNHLDELKKMNCDLIDMESSAFVAACKKMNFNCAVVFCVSDNVVEEKPLYKLPPSATSYRKALRRKILPFLIEDFLNEDYE